MNKLEFLCSKIAYYAFWHFLNFIPILHVHLYAF